MYVFKVIVPMVVLYIFQSVTIQEIHENKYYVLIQPISTEYKLLISSFINQNKTPILWEAAPRSAHLFDDIAHSKLSGFTTIQTHKIKDQGGREGGCD